MGKGAKSTNSNSQSNMKILAFPKATNPYQELLYTPLRKRGISISYLQQCVSSHTLWILFIFIPQIIYFRAKGYKIFHLHWLYPFSFPLMNNLFSRLFFTIYTPICLLIIKLIGFKLIWTVHNLISHEKQFLNDYHVAIFLSKLSDAIIVHSPNSIPLMKELDYATNSLYVIPFGNFIEYYPSTVTYLESRNKFGIEQKDTVFLFFGLIRSYKGFSELVKVFSHLMEKHISIKLFIAGECPDKNTKEVLIDFQGKYRNQIFLSLHHISDKEVQYYFNCADAIAIPFKNVTTSSSAVLAFSFGKPVIAPLMGNIVDFPSYTGVYYNPDDIDGFNNSIKDSIKRRKELPEMGRKAYRYAKTLSWAESAEKTHEVFKSLIDD